MSKIYLTLIGLAVLLSEVSVASGRFDGVTKPISDLDLSVSVDGVVHQLFVSEGQHVKKGEPLLRLDDRLQAFEARLRKQILNDKARYESSKYNRDIVESLLKSARELQKSTGSVSNEEVMRLDMQFNTVAGEVRAMEQAKKREKLEYDAAQAELERHTLVSPIDGIVTEVLLDVGEWAQSGEVVIKVVDPSSCFLEVNIEERQVRHLQELDAVPVFVSAGDRTLEKSGKVVFVSPVADQASGLVRVKLRFENLERDVWPGMPASIEFGLDETDMDAAMGEFYEPTTSSSNR
ncbi:efflux RND transporter periplasmic adaptor subunit [Pseudomaricurvus alkylphenolicus]|jgi:RND family efflux transporter MFP subunit|uniref:efflux RND transporter periplasmic adaptor subunit n=1 Tax=Pseudomaricurvus alkylphenolicus TaxID=1306991 RepID=UPI001422C001|nr:efflux RND transporter periplasmic adaptor subunit [Pseudomaricurvus alkylphenolicus]NIB44506.1 efflux RND transporter periplasmic adaptor subunit [Pseudomaricurvus alkylphenolicus]